MNKKIRNFGAKFSDEFSVDPDWMMKNRVFNPTLDVDSLLFIDPFLLPRSKHQEIADDAFETYEQHFLKIFSLLKASSKVGDKPWQAALKMFKFSEAKGMSGTCIGYSKSTDGGRAFGPIKSAQSLNWAQQLISYGIKDPEIFSALGLFEKGIGQDLISDMVLNIILDHILVFNDKILTKIKVDLGINIVRDKFELAGRNAKLPINPHSDKKYPVILLPSDILKHVSVLDDPRNISEAIIENDRTRDRVNDHLSSLFAAKHKKDRQKIIDQAREDNEALQALLDALKELERKPYDFLNDPKGLLSWVEIGKKFSKAFPLELKINKKLKRIEQIEQVCLTIIEKFNHTIVNSRFSRDLYNKDGDPKPEAFAQRLFMVVADSYCEANDIDISPESDKGAGPVDFKFSRGIDKITVEIKLSTNPKLVAGYEKQLEAYTDAEKAKRSHYVVIDVGRMGKKRKKLNDFIKKNPAKCKHKRVHYINGSIRPSASKLV